MCVCVFLSALVCQWKSRPMHFGVCVCVCVKTDAPAVCLSRSVSNASLVPLFASSAVPAIKFPKSEELN